jgi:uncharacterized membrane protein YccC
MNLPRLPRFTRAEILFSLKSFAAAMLTMYIANRAGLPRPFWSMLTSYIVAAPLAGNVRSKALFRFCGTLVGCTAVVFIVPALANAPELLTLALALWVGGCLYLSLLDRTARSYVFMLAGYTAALIGFPSVETPLALFDNAMARVEEIGLGILCATLVHSLVLPVGMGPTLLGILDRSLGDARQWFADALRPLRRTEAGGAALGTDRQRLAADITQLRLLSTHVPFDTSHLRWTAGAIGSMQDSLAALTPALSAVEDRLQSLLEAEGELAPDVAAVLAQTSAWLDAETAGAAPAGPQRELALDSLLAALHALGEDDADAPEEATPAAWRRALRIGLAVRLEELVRGWRACKALRRDIDAGLTGSPAPLPRTGALSNRVLHKDTGLALLSAFAAVLAICLCNAFWIFTAWPSGSAAAMMAAVFCCFFAVMDDPAPAIGNFMKFTILSTPISAIYVLVLLPVVHDFGMIALVCAPVFLVLGCLSARPATAGAAMAMIMGIAGTLSMHDTSADVSLPAFINSTLGQVVGILFAALTTRLVRSVGADWSAQRIRRATWHELGTMAAAPREADVDEAYAVRMVDRIALLAPRIVKADALVRNETVEGALRDLRAGVDIVALQRARARLPSCGIGEVMRDVARLFRERGAGREGHAPATLLAELDRVLARALAIRVAAPDPAGRRDAARAAVTALVGLRRTLFPGAPSALNPGVPA